MNKNNHGQPVDDKQHVLKQSEIIAEQLKSLDRAMYQDEPYGDIKLPLKDLVAFIMEYSNKDWSANVRHGIQLGRKDAVRMLQSLQYNTYYTATNKTGIAVQAVPVEELQKVITALEETA